jgi:2-polyprenyl-3-methyl-5-hydroxy-6-metoxy-1,4-benzoquinol methylase
MNGGETFFSYTGPRTDVLQLVPPTPRRVLDVGCATGRVGEEIKRRTGAEVWGIERDDAFAGEAAHRLDRVVAGDVDEILPRLRGEHFDVVICADILEHLPDPERSLAGIRDVLERSGCVVVSLPNVRFYDTFVQLGVKGTWPRRERGIYDRTHLHWFTDADARALFAGAGFVVDVARSNYRLIERPSRVNAAAHHFARGPLRGFLAYQHLYRLKPEDPG